MYSILQRNLLSTFFLMRFGIGLRDLLVLSDEVVAPPAVEARISACEVCSAWSPGDSFASSKRPSLFRDTSRSLLESSCSASSVDESLSVRSSSTSSKPSRARLKASLRCYCPEHVRVISFRDDVSPPNHYGRLAVAQCTSFCRASASCRRRAWLEVALKSVPIFLRF